MGSQLLPLFPLGLVLLPGMPAPLHIFEERYKEMMADIMPNNGEFGIVFAKEEGIVNVGCTATVEKVLRRYEDGRLDLIVSGKRRFEIESLDEGKSYLRAEIEYFDDEDDTNASRELREKAAVLYKQLTANEEPHSPVQPNFNSPRLSFQIAQFISDLDERQTLLSLRSEVERLEHLVRIVPAYVKRQERIALAKRVAPLNGHAKHVVTS